MGSKPLTSLREAFLEVRREESQRHMFSKEQMELLRNIFNNKSAQPETIISMGTVAPSGNCSTTLCSQSHRNNPWIINSGIPNHMTGNESLFDDFMACAEH